MFGLGLYNAYVGKIDFLGGTDVVFLVALTTRLLVGVGWFFLFKKAGKNPVFAFVPLVGPYAAFRLVWDDFSMAAIFAGSTLCGFVDAIGIQYPIIHALAILNFILWWFMALLTSRCFQTNMIVGFVYGGVSWFGSILMGLWPAYNYKGPWSTDPEAEQNLSAKERKKRRKKAAKEVKAQEAQAKKSKAK